MNPSPTKERSAPRPEDASKLNELQPEVPKSTADSKPIVLDAFFMHSVEGHELEKNGGRIVSSNVLPISACVGHMTLAEERRIKDEARRLYSTQDVRRDLRRPLPPHRSEDFDDVILLASYLLTGQRGDLSASLEWFGERIAIDYPDCLPTVRVVPPSPPQADHPETPRKDPSTPSRRIQTPIESQPHDPIGKNTDNVPLEEKTPTMVRKKTLTMVREKTPTYSPVQLCVVVSYERLDDWLIEHNQGEWSSPVRRHGLMLLLDFIYRLQKQRKSKGVLVFSRSCERIRFRTQPTQEPYHPSTASGCPCQTWNP
jgi:hypothetical protein